MSIVFDGLIITSGPPGASFVIGICTYEQNDWYEPMTPTTRSLRENAFAFAPQRKKSSPPPCAVEESHAWNPTENPPASKPRCSRARRMPPTMDCPMARLSPWSGRLDTSRMSGLPLPP